MRRLIPVIAVLFLTLNTNADAATISFSTDPFAGSTALTTPGRQVVGGELFTAFDIGADVFEFNTFVFGIDEILFANDLAGNLPTSDVNVVVLQSLDNDGDPLTPFGAGNAANLIAAQITEPGPGFFIYFNSGLNLPRLVFSTDLSENTVRSENTRPLDRLQRSAGCASDIHRSELLGDASAGARHSFVDDDGRRCLVGGVAPIQE